MTENVEQKKRRVWPWFVGAGGVLAAAYVGAAVSVADQIPTNTSVYGVEVGGLSEADAAAKLDAELGSELIDAVPIVISGTDVSGEFQPAEVGAEFDAEATVDGLTGLSFNPANLWRHVAGSTTVDPVVTFDESKMKGAISALNDQLSTKPLNAEIEFAGSTVRTTPATPGVGLDVDQTSQILSEGWLTAPRPIELPSADILPEITDEDVAKIKETAADPLVAGPLNIAVQDKVATLSPADLAAAATFEEKDGELSLHLDARGLLDEVLKQTGDVLTPAKDAQIVMDGHTAPKIIPSEDGLAIDEKETEKLIADKATSAERDLKAVVIADEPELTTEKAKELGVKEVVAEIETPLTADPVRTKNLEVGTSRTNNTLVLPGEEFSLFAQLGPISEENGFVSSGVVMNGFNSTALGGGLSQLSTNTFNLGYRGGMEDIQHKPHSKYFDRYPMGVESTLWEPDLDMRWKNNSPYAVLVETWIQDGMVKSRLWSTKYYDVDITVSQPYNQKAATMKDNPNHDCVPMGPGAPGFTVDVHRVVKHGGDVVYDNSYSWTYQPVDGSRCV